MIDTISANDNHVAIAVRCGGGEDWYEHDCVYDYAIAIFEGETFGDALGKFAAWKLDEAVLNLDGAWRSFESTRKCVREWFFPPVPRGFDFAAVKAQAKRSKEFYTNYFTSKQEEKRSSDCYCFLPYEEQFSHFIGVLKFYSQKAKQGFDLKGLRISPPYPYLPEEGWKPAKESDETFSHVPYFIGYDVGGADDYVILKTAAGSEAVARLKDRYSGIDCEKIEDGLREAYEKKQYRVFNRWGEDEDLGGTLVDAKGMIFSRRLLPLTLEEPECEKYEWEINVGMWPKDGSPSWRVSLESERILDKMVIELLPQECRKRYAKWWLKHSRRSIDEAEWNSF